MNRLIAKLHIYAKFNIAWMPSWIFRLYNNITVCLFNLSRCAKRLTELRYCICIGTGHNAPEAVILKSGVPLQWVYFKAFI